jgi:hypothetical protein
VGGVLYPEGDFNMRADEWVREAERESKLVDALFKTASSDFHA